MSSRYRIDRLDVTVEVIPEPGLLRPSIEAALAGRALGDGAEAIVAGAVRDAVRAATTLSTIRESRGAGTS